MSGPVKLTSRKSVRLLGSVGYSMIAIGAASEARMPALMMRV